MEKLDKPWLKYALVPVNMVYIASSIGWLE
jgi:hypothetical protein